MQIYNLFLGAVFNVFGGLKHLFGWLFPRTFICSYVIPQAPGRKTTVFSFNKIHEWLAILNLASLTALGCGA